jgi:hypothetical protein
MSVQLSDQEKIDRAAFHEEVRFLKKQQWAVATAGAVLSGAFLAAISNYHMTRLDRFLAVLLIAVGVWAGWFFLDDLQCGLARIEPEFSGVAIVLRGNRGGPVS